MTYLLVAMANFRLMPDQTTSKMGKKGNYVHTPTIIKLGNLSEIFSLRMKSLDEKNSATVQVWMVMSKN